VTAAARVLRGRRVTLRPYADGFGEPEIDRFYAWARDGEVTALSGGTTLALPPDRFRQLFLERMPQRNSEREQQFAILDETGELIGRTGLFALEPRSRVAELGIMIGQKERWGQAYGRDAVRTLCAFGFDDLGLERIVLFTFPTNKRAQRCFSAVGFRAVRKVRRLTLESGVRTEIEMDLTPPRLASTDEALADGGQEQGAYGRDHPVAPDGGVLPHEPDVRGERAGLEP